MPLSDFLSSLYQTVSTGTLILVDHDDLAFKSALERWSSEGVEIPGAIIKPNSEQDISVIVNHASEQSVQFVLASGGHSPWSTINESGFILDLTLCNAINIDEEKNTVKVTGAVLVKELAVALSKAGRCTTLGNGNTVGVIPYCIGGGTSILAAVIGFACDQIVGAKVITADGSIVHANPETEPDLLWASKGAGQYFGVVIELTLKTFPLSLMGSPDGSHWVGDYLYSLEQAEGVCKTLEKLMVTTEYNTAGIVMVMAPPPSFQPMLAVVLHFLEDTARASAAFRSLSEIGPLMSSSSTPSFDTFRDPFDYACAKGDFKRFSLAGISEFKTENFLKVIDLFKGLLVACPDAGASGYAFEWHTSKTKLEPQDSAFGHQNTLLWMNCFSWYHKRENHDVVADFESRTLAAMRSGQAEDDFIDFPNCDRTGPVQRRYPGAARIKKLSILKKKWDPNGVFTKQFL